MCAQEVTLPERKARKSVAFSEGTTIMDENGQVKESVHVDKETAEKHSTGMSLVATSEFEFAFGMSNSYNRSCFAGQGSG